MAIKSSFKNGSLILMNPKTHQLANESDSDVLDDFSDDSINSDELDSEYASDRSDGEQSYSESELLPLSEIWDLDDKDKVSAQSTIKNSSTDIKLDDKFEEELDELSDSSDDSSSSENYSENESDSSTSGDEADSESDVFEGFDDDDEAQNGLKTVMKNLAKATKKKEKQKSKLISLNQKESELSIPTSSANKLSLQDMMMTLLEVSGSKSSKTPSLLRDIKEVTPLAIPLPRRIQERNERSAAYEISKKEVEKWKDQVEKIKRSEVMKFPLIGEEDSNLMQKKVSAFIASDAPSNELEDKVNSMLRDSMLLDTKKEALFEDLKASKISKEELIKKTNETRLMRELLFREERKAKRIKKIKSKSYRRIKKKELLKNAELMKEIEGDDIDKDEDDEARAEARMTLKFKNSSSKWAKDMIKHGMTKDKETRAEMESMLQQGQKLRLKILGHGEDSDPSDEELNDISDSDTENEEETAEYDKKLASVGKTGFMNMPFMKKAEAKLKEQNKQEKAKLARLEQGLDIEDFKEGSTSKAKVILNSGRRIYAPEAHSAATKLDEQNKKTIEEQTIDESDNLLNKLNEKFNNDKRNDKKNRATDALLNDDNHTKTSSTNDEQKNTEEAVNPWLSSDSVKKSSKIKVIDESSTRAEKQAHKLDKKKRKKSSSSDNNDQTLINTDVSLNITNQANNFSSDDENDDDDGIIDSFQQKKIIKEAFIGDNVVKEFNRDKKRVIEEEDDQWITAEQPGFNSWIGGSDTQRKKQKKNIKKKKVEGIKSKDKRTDKELKNVIFNEKVNKKGLKYQSSGVPFPFENKEQYERSLRMPIGQEWNTRSTFQKNTMPSVITKSGTVIKPLNRKFR